jgi:hypothetical protein
MTERIFDNRFRRGKCHFELSGTSSVGAELSGARFESATLDEEIGPETALFLTDSTPFAYDLKRERFDLHLKSGAAQTSAGPILFLLWWMPPITNGTPFALYEHILNPAHEGVLKGLRQIARQTHLHLVLIGPGRALLGVYEFENVFGLDKLIPVVENACQEYGSMDFIAAKEEYDRKYDLMELFSTSDGGTDEPESEEEFPEDDPDEEIPDDENFLMPQCASQLIDGAAWLAGKLLLHSGCTPEERDALTKALIGIARLPRTTPGLCVDFGFGTSGSGDMRCWSVHIDETEVMWSSGGYVHGPAGGDSYTSFQLSLLRGSEDAPIGNQNAWFGVRQFLEDTVNVHVNDGSDEDFWERYAPMAALRDPFSSVLLEQHTTFRYSPNASDYLLWVRCTNPFCSAPEFTIVDFWEFHEGDKLLITNREEDYPATAEQMEEGSVPFLWKVMPGDRLAWVGWRRAPSNERHPTVVALVDCRHKGYVYGEPGSPTLESVMLFGAPTADGNPEIRRLWKVGFDAAVALGLPES